MRNEKGPREVKIAQLKRHTEVVIPQMQIAEDLWSRTQGLLGRKSLPPDQALWIHRCNSIHTWFMNFAIDCVFVDRQLSVVSLKKNIGPWRLVWPQWGASSVIEMSAGSVERFNIQVGDQLNVGPASS